MGTSQSNNQTVVISQLLLKTKCKNQPIKQRPIKVLFLNIIPRNFCSITMRAMMLTRARYLLTMRGPNCRPSASAGWPIICVINAFLGRNPNVNVKPTTHHL